jgi:D-alanyl-D-alanine dipeptidase
MRFVLLLFFMTCGALVYAQDATKLLGDAKKLIVVNTPDWNSVSGTMMRYERKGKSWKKVANPTEIVVGKNGVAWDEHFAARSTDASALVKREGDGRSPAGVFRISHSFGFAPKITNNEFYLPITPTTECVDDVNSKYYNQIVDRLNIKDVDWNSSEKMRQVDGYRYGAVVAYNDPPAAGRGSCIFLHIWGGPGQGTAGCTAMPDADAQGLLRWLDDKTVLVQMPEAEYERMKGSLSLP